MLYITHLNPLTPNDPYSGRTASLTSKRSILYIYSTNIITEYFKYGIYSPFFFSSKCSLFRNSNVFGSCVIHILYTVCAKIKKKFRRQKVNGKDCIQIPVFWVFTPCYIVCRLSVRKFGWRRCSTLFRNSCDTCNYDYVRAGDFRDVLCVATEVALICLTNLLTLQEVAVPEFTEVCTMRLSESTKHL